MPSSTMIGVAAIAAAAALDAASAAAAVSDDEDEDEDEDDEDGAREGVAKETEALAANAGSFPAEAIVPAMLAKAGLEVCCVGFARSAGSVAW
jgi:hypothetical protein